MERGDREEEEEEEEVEEGEKRGSSEERVGPPTDIRIAMLVYNSSPLAVLPFSPLLSSPLRLSWIRR